MTNSRLDKIKQASEGKLFIHRWLSVFMSKSVFYSEDYYVVREGVVYSIHTDLKERASGDNVENVLAECECLGDYNTAKIQKQEFEYIDYKEIRNHFIKKL